MKTKKQSSQSLSKNLIFLSGWGELEHQEAKAIGFRLIYRALCQKRVYLFLITLSILLSLPSFGEVNILTGAYIYHKELSLSKETTLRLTYNSRSNNTGLFGKGWCSALDYKLTMTSSLKELELETCEFQPPSRFQVLSPPIFSSHGRGHVLQTKKGLTWYAKDGAIFNFGKKGKLRSIHFTNGKTIKVAWTPQQKLSEIQTESLRYQVQLEQGTIRSLTKKFELKIVQWMGLKERGPQSTERFHFRFHYQAQRLSLIQSPENEDRFVYDSSGNLRQRQNHNGALNIHYDERDRVKSTQSSSCQTSYKYEVFSFHKLMVSKNRSCSDKKEKESFEILTQLNQNGRRSLFRLTKFSPLSSQSIYFDLETGQVKKTVEGQRVSNYHYDDLGRLSLVQKFDRRLSFKYQGLKTLSEKITEERLNPQGVPHNSPLVQRAPSQISKPFLANKPKQTGGS